MTPPRRRTKTVAVQAAEMAVAVPQVVAHRVARMALAGASPSPRDRQEFHRMSAEKLEAFQQSWSAMARQMWFANQQVGASWMKAITATPSKRAGALGAAQRALGIAALGVLGTGMAPVHRKAVANAKRLGRTKLK